MKKLTAKFLEVVALSVLVGLGASIGCSSSSAGGSGGTTGAGSGGSTTVGSGGSTGAGTGGATPGTNPDANCTNALAKTGVACTQDCVGVPSGLNSAGTRNCPCANGAYTSCTVTKPANWGGPELAPCCPAGTTIVTRRNTPCDVEWAECVTSDAMSGTTYQGCACMMTAGVLNWECGSTNKWFSLDLASNGGAATCL